MRELCHLNQEYVELEFGRLNTTKVVLTSERDEHIRMHHPQDYALFERYGVEVIEHPEIVLRDRKNSNTILMVRRLAEIHMNVVVRLSIHGQDPKENMNSVLTFFRLRQSNLKKQIAKNKVIYIREDS